MTNIVKLLLVGLSTGVLLTPTTGSAQTEVTYSLEPDSVVWYDLDWADTIVDESGTKWGKKWVDADGVEWDLLAPDTVFPQPSMDSIFDLINNGEHVDYPRGGVAGYVWRYRVVDVRDAETGESIPYPDWTELLDSAWVTRPTFPPHLEAQGYEVNR